MADTMAALPPRTGGELEGLTTDVEWKAGPTAAGVTYSSVRGTPTVFHLRDTCILLARQQGSEPFAVTFAASAESFVTQALAQILREFRQRPYDIQRNVTALFAGGTTRVFDTHGGELSDVTAADLQGWTAHALLGLRGSWNTQEHAGLCIDALQIQLIHPPGGGTSSWQKAALLPQDWTL